MIRTLLNYFSFVVAGALLLLMATVIHFWPASFWLSVRDVRVFDARVGQPVLMAVDRTIHRGFFGEWTASIRKMQNGKWYSFCVARGSTFYKPDSVYPDPLTLRWWTHPDCHPLDEGKYVMHTTWVVKGESLMPDKITHSDSNIFEVKP